MIASSKGSRPIARTGKAIRFLIAAAVAVFVVAGTAWAGGSRESATTSSSSGKAVPLTAIVVTHPLTKDVNTILWLQKIQKKAGVKVTWQQIKSDWPQKKATLFASGNIPDMIIGAGGATNADFAQFTGLFAPLNGLIKKDGPYIQKMFEQKPILKLIATQRDGNIYGLPKYQRYWPRTATRQMINKAWLKKLGLQAPTNWDQLYKVLVAFKTQDPNGDGKADQVPLTWAPGMGFFNVLSLLGGYGITLTNGVDNGYWVDNGTVKNFLVSDRYKQLVAFLHKCWQAGLIDPNVFTETYTQYQSVARHPGAPVVGFTFGWGLMDRFGKQWASQYETIPPLTPSAGYAGRVTWEYDYYNLNYGEDMAEISANSKHKDAAMRFIDEFYNPIVSMQVLFGSMGPNIKDNGNGTYQVLPPKDTSMDPGTWKWTSTLADDGPMYIADSLHLTLGTDMQAIAAWTKPFAPALDTVNPKKDVWPGLFIKYTTEDNDLLARLQTNLTNLSSSMFAHWVTKGGVDGQWNSYVQQMDRAGLKRVLKVMQTYYDKLQSNSMYAAMKTPK